MMNSPDKKSNEFKVIFAGAHPDDIELGCGGTIASFVEKGYEVQCINLTKGGKGQVPKDGPKVRAKESIEACVKLGIDKQKIIFSNFEDTRIPDSIESIRFLERLYLHDPDNLYAVFVPSVYEINQDHRAVANASITAFKYVPRILAYESLSTTSTFHPTSFVDITPFLKTKWRALKCHESQIKQNKMYLEYRAMLCLTSFRGRQVGVKYAEAFQTIKFLI